MLGNRILSSKFALCLCVLIYSILYKSTDASGSSESNKLRIVRSTGPISAQMREYIQMRMLKWSRRESSIRRLAVECSRPVRRACAALRRYQKCRSSVLTKRSLESDVSYIQEYWFDTQSREITGITPQAMTHHIVRRSARRRRKKKIRISCQLCRDKCWS